MAASIRGGGFLPKQPRRGYSSNTPTKSKPTSPNDACTMATTIPKVDKATFGWQRTFNYSRGTIRTLRSKRLEEQRRAQEHLVNYALMIEVIHAKEPKCLVEAQGDDRWMEAMQSKCGSIMKNNTWDLVDRPPKCKVIRTKWVYKTKYTKKTLDKYQGTTHGKGFRTSTWF